MVCCWVRRYTTIYVEPREKLSLNMSSLETEKRLEHVLELIASSSPLVTVSVAHA